MIVTAVPASPELGERLVMPGVRVKSGPLLGMAPTVTTTPPVVAPEGTEATILVSLQVVGGAGVPLNVSELDPCEAPKLLPLTVTEAPTGPDIGLTLVITGATPKNDELLTRPPTVTMIGELPATTPAGTGTTMVVELQLAGVPAVPPNVTVLAPCDAPKLVPVIVTEVPTGPKEGEMPVMLG